MKRSDFPPLPIYPPLSDPDAPVEDTEHVSRLVLQGIELHWTQLLAEEGWHGLAHAFQANASEHPITSGFRVAVSTMLLGLTGERRRISWPATWQQHVKQAVLQRMGHEMQPNGLRWRLFMWLRPKLGRVRMATEEVQVYQSACPHISAGGKHNPQLCIDYLHRMQGRGYDGADFLLSQAHAILSCALEPVMPPDQPFDAFRQAQDLDGAARRVLELLQEAMDATGDTPTDGPCTCPHCDNGHGCCCCKE